MDLLDRYLNAVRFWLPAAQEDDLIAEMGEDIRSEIEDREATLGRTLSEDELAALLKQRGHPMRAAGRYLPPRYLIGPALYPVYILVMRLVLLWVVLPICVFVALPIAIVTAADPTLAGIKSLVDSAMGCVFAVGLITLAFAIIERHPIKDLESWDPRKLPQVPASLKSLAAPKPVERVEAIVDMVLGALFTALLLRVIWFRSSFDLGNIHIVLAPVWRVVLWPMLVIGLTGIPLGWVSLAFPTKTRLRAGIRMAMDAATLGVTGVLARAGTLVTLTVSNLPPAQAAEAAKWVDIVMRITVSAIAIGALVNLTREGIRYYRAGRVSAPAHR